MPLMYMTWLTASWDECHEESGKCLGIPQCLESDHPETTEELGDEVTSYDLTINVFFRSGVKVSRSR